MKLTAEQYELIEAYLNGQLAPADRTEVEADRQNDAEFDQEIRLQQELRAGFRAIGLQNRLQAARQRHQARTAPPARPEPKIIPLSSKRSGRVGWEWTTYQPWVAAASVVLLIGLSVWGIWQPSESQFDETVYAQNYQPDPSDFVARDLPASLKPNDRVALERGIQSYSQGKYAEAIDVLEKVAPPDNSLFIASYYLGISYLTTPNVDKAVKYLQTAQRSTQPDIRQKAQWYLALAYLKKDDRPRTKSSLRVVADDTRSPYRNRAGALLDQLFP
ncbi:MAG: hypothetical protein LH606_07455 [Cytophagaceae bacterium]|nr:hypothetical protein [Cytophagaceae bacterium]